MSDLNVCQENKQKKNYKHYDKLFKHYILNTHTVFVIKMTHTHVEHFNSLNSSIEFSKLVNFCSYSIQRVLFSDKQTEECIQNVHENKCLNDTNK